MFLYWFVFELKTARFETLATTAPLCCLTWVNLPPIQMLVPTCSMALYGPVDHRSLVGLLRGQRQYSPAGKNKSYRRRQQHNGPSQAYLLL